MVTNRERDYMYQMYAADKRARINLGIRRRLAPLLENDHARIKLMKSLLLSMPGSPILYYGDEIGMGDNIYLGDRDGVRTPMQWGPDRNAGFSRADPQRLYLQPIMDPIYGYEAVSSGAAARAVVAFALDAPDAGGAQGLSRVRARLAHVPPARQSQDPRLSAHLRRRDPAVRGEPRAHRAAGRARPVEVQGTRADRAPRAHAVPADRRSSLPLLTLTGHGSLWFRLASGEDLPAWHEERLPPDDLPVLVLFDGWASLFRDRVVPWRIAISDKVRTQLEREALPQFIGARRWYAGKGQGVRRVELTDHVEWKQGPRHWLVAMTRVESADGETQGYFLPMTLAWEDHDDEMLRTLGPLTIAKARQHSQVGVIGDAFGDEAFCRALVAAVEDGAELQTELREDPLRPDARVHRSCGSGHREARGNDARRAGSNTIVALGDRLFLKSYRRIREGLNPEVEIGRFLTDAGFEHAVPIAGSIDYVSNDGRTATLAIVQAYVSNQGDAWSYTLEYLDRFFDGLPREGDAVDAPGSAEAMCTVGTCRLHERSGCALRSCMARSRSPAVRRHSIRSRSPAPTSRRGRGRCMRKRRTRSHCSSGGATTLRRPFAKTPTTCSASAMRCWRGSAGMRPTPRRGRRRGCTATSISGRC